MSRPFQISDSPLLDLLRQFGALGVAELARRLGVTATAVRQRLARLTEQGLVERETLNVGRGRPSHRYRLTPAGARSPGSNYGDLAEALWKELREIRDPEVRRGLFARLAKSLAGMYEPQVAGATTAERMESVGKLFEERHVPFAVETNPGSLPVLTALACPYPGLAEQDRGICAVERMLFSDLVGAPVRLADCRLDGATCCRFEVN